MYRGGHCLLSERKLHPIARPSAESLHQRSAHQRFTGAQVRDMDRTSQCIGERAINLLEIGRQGVEIHIMNREAGAQRGYGWTLWIKSNGTGRLHLRKGANAHQVTVDLVLGEWASHALIDITYARHTLRSR